MSILLDALKKSEELRQLGKAPSIHSPVAEPGDGRSLLCVPRYVLSYFRNHIPARGETSYITSLSLSSMARSISARNCGGSPGMSTFRNPRTMVEVASSSLSPLDIR